MSKFNCVYELSTRNENTNVTREYVCWSIMQFFRNLMFAVLYSRIIFNYLFIVFTVKL